MVTLRSVDRPRRGAFGLRIILMTVSLDPRAMALTGGAATGPLLVLATERVIATALGVAGGGLPVAAGATPVLALVAPTGPCRGSSAPATSPSGSGSGWRSRAGCFASTTRSCWTKRRRRFVPLEEQAVYQRFMKIAAGRTAIIVTHRLGAAGRPHPGAGRRPHRRRRHPRAPARPPRPCTTACSRPRPPGTGEADGRVEMEVDVQL